jgi:hypothetical protein
MWEVSSLMSSRPKGYSWNDQKKWTLKKIWVMKVNEVVGWYEKLKQRRKGGVEKKKWGEVRK